MYNKIIFNLPLSHGMHKLITKILGHAKKYNFSKADNKK